MQYSHGEPGWKLASETISSQRMLSSRRTVRRSSAAPKSSTTTLCVPDMPVPYGGWLCLSLNYVSIAYLVA